jgi:hypothetical protein
MHIGKATNVAAQNGLPPDRRLRTDGLIIRAQATIPTDGFIVRDALAGTRAGFK